MELKAIIFDIDGTLVDSEFAVLASLKKTLNSLYSNRKIAKNIETVLGIPGKEGLLGLGFSESETETILPIWARNFSEINKHSPVFGGIDGVLKELKKQEIAIAVVTSKTKKEYEDDFAFYEIATYFGVAVTADDTELHKPNPQPLLKCLERLKVNAKDALYIGDSVYDMQCAAGAKVKSALALWGCNNPTGIARDFDLASPRDILQLVLNK